MKNKEKLEKKLNCLHTLSVFNEGDTKLDEFKLKGVLEYKIAKNFEDPSYNILTLTLIVSDFKLS